MFIITIWNRHWFTGVWNSKTWFYSSIFIKDLVPNVLLVNEEGDIWSKVIESNVIYDERWWEKKHRKKQINNKRARRNILLNAMPEEATTHVCTTVFSCLVKGCFKIPAFPSNEVQNLRMAKPNKPAATLSEGITPVVRLSLQTMKLNTILKTRLVNMALKVICFAHGGTSVSLNPSSTITSSFSSAEETWSSPSKGFV